MGLGTTIADFFFPPRCLFCSDLLEKERRDVCPKCESTLRTTGRESLFSGEGFAGGAAPLWYRDEVRRAFHRYKFSGKTGGVRYFGQLMADCVKGAYGAGFDVVTWVPSGAVRRWRRGYDQAQLLAREVARCLGLPLALVLVKSKNAPSQTTMQSDAERRANVADAFHLRRGADVRGVKILLVDDVYTTGASLSAASSVLMAAGAGSVHCVTLLRARRGGKQYSARENTTDFAGIWKG